MTEADRPQFLKIINGLATVKPGAKLTQEALDMYWLAMKGWSLEDFEAAAMELMRTAEFFPNPYHFNEIRKAQKQSAGEAFQIAMGVARNCSRYVEPTSGDALIDAVANACGGYFAMGMQETEKMGFLERRFAEHFDAISDKEETRKALPDLTGGPKYSVDVVLKSLKASTKLLS